MKILGVDPSSSCTAWAISSSDNHTLYNYGRIKLKSSMEGRDKLGTVYHALQELFSDYDIQMIAVEDQVVNRKFPAAGLVVARYRGVVELLAYDAGVPIKIWHPATVKKHLTGKGNASKEMMIEAAKCKFNISGKLTDDEADAIAIADLTAKQLAGGMPNGNI